MFQITRLAALIMDTVSRLDSVQLEAVYTLRVPVVLLFVLALEIERMVIFLVKVNTEIVCNLPRTSNFWMLLIITQMCIKQDPAHLATVLCRRDQSSIGWLMAEWLFHVGYVERPADVTCLQRPR